MKYFATSGTINMYVVQKGTLNVNMIVKCSWSFGSNDHDPLTTGVNAPYKFELCATFCHKL